MDSWATHLQSADILIYKAGLVPVGEDQVAHVEFTREVARRFNFIYGREVDFEEKAEVAVTKMGKKQSKLYRALRKSLSRDRVTIQHLEFSAKALLGEAANLSLWVIVNASLVTMQRDGGKMILYRSLRRLLTAKPLKCLAWMGRKMSKSYNNTISLKRGCSHSVEQKITIRMPTDPARVRRTDPGDPKKLPGLAVASDIFIRRHSQVGK